MIPIINDNKYKLYQIFRLMLYKEKKKGGSLRKPTHKAGYGDREIYACKTDDTCKD